MPARVNGGMIIECHQGELFSEGGHTTDKKQRREQEGQTQQQKEGHLHCRERIVGICLFFLFRARVAAGCGLLFALFPPVTEAKGKEEQSIRRQIDQKQLIRPAELDNDVEKKSRGNSRGKSLAVRELGRGAHVASRLP